MKGTDTWKQGAKKTNVIASETISESVVGGDASQRFTACLIVWLAEPFPVLSSILISIAADAYELVSISRQHDAARAAHNVECVWYDTSWNSACSCLGIENQAARSRTARLFHMTSKWSVRCSHDARASVTCFSVRRHFVCVACPPEETKEYLLANAFWHGA